MRRLFACTITALLVGVAINVGVAWGFALRGPTVRSKAVHGAEHDELTGMSWVVTVREARGITLVWTRHHRGRLRDPVLARTPPSQIVPPISGFRDRPATADDVHANRLDDACERPEEHGTLRAMMATGWPQPALWCAYHGNGAVVLCGQNALWDTDVAGGLPVGDGIRRDCDMRVRRALPLRPVWPGFAVNALLFAGCVLPFLLGATVVHERTTRLKRGYCPDCSHPIRERSSCTNCGRPLPGAGSDRPRRSPNGGDRRALRRRVRGPAAVAAIALGLGALTTTAVAWSCACQKVPSRRYARLSQVTIESETFRRWFLQWPPHFPADPSDPRQTHRFGIVHTRDQARGRRQNTIHRDGMIRGPQVWKGERWIASDDVEPEVANDLGNRSFDRLLVEAGWPRRAFHGSMRTIERIVPPQPGVGPQDRLIAEDRSGLMTVRIGKSRRALVPLVPAWGGFALNTLLYAAAWAGLLGAPLWLRRFVRRRAGRCPSCAYPAGGDAACTECGEVLPAFDGPALLPGR